MTTPSTRPHAADPAPDNESREPRAPDFSAAVVADLYRYTEKRYDLALIICVFTGVLGGHRLYLDRPASAFAMLLSAGGGLVWWIVDLFRLRRMVETYNAEQRARHARGLPPKALSFMPALDGKPLADRPHWAKRRDGRGQIIGGAAVLTVAGVGLGVVSSATGNVEAIVAVLALIAVTLLGARWQLLARLPILGALDRWNHRLRLYYFITEPGGLFTLALRPIAGIFAAPWSKRAWAEARLHLQLGIWVTMLFGLLDIAEAAPDGFSASDLVDLLLDFALTLVTVYAFAAPMGAILTTQLLLSRSDRVVWIMSLVAIAAIGLGGLIVS